MDIVPSLENKIISYLKLLSNSSKAKNNKELNDKIQIYSVLEKQISDYQNLLISFTDITEKELLLEEIELIKKEQGEIFESIKKKILDNEGIKQSIIMEIRAGTGGTEASLFVQNIYSMYAKLAENKKWKIEMIEHRIDNEGGLTFASLIIKGNLVYNLLKYEAGVHRVQRVPKTENKGRIHTSTISVAILPEPNDIALHINPQELRIDTFCSGGPGGQHVNKTASAVRIVHLPTGITANSQDGRDQHSNREKAYAVLKSRILDKIKREDKEQRDKLRNDMIGNNERSQKIRTYNWPQNRVTDHRLALSWNKLNLIINGELQEIIDKLIDWEIENKIDNNFLEL